MSLAAQGANITPGNLVVFRVGDGSAALGSTATAAFIDEYTALGALVQSIPITASGGGAFSVVGNSTTEGILSVSGSNVHFAGYSKAVGGTNPSSDSGAVTNRLIGSLGAAGTVSTIAVTDAAGAARSATMSGTAAYLSTASGIRYINTAAAGPYTSTVIDTRNSREVMLLPDNTLVASNGSTTITGKVQGYGVLPTTTTAATALVSLTLSDAVNGFWAADLDSGVVGIDTIYAMSTVANSLAKFSLVGGNWVSNGVITATGFQNVTGAVNGGTVNLFVTSPGALSTLADTSGYNGALGGSLTNLATAGPNTAFRGVAYFAPVPEPSLAALGLLGTVGLLRRRRR